MASRKSICDRINRKPLAACSTKVGDTLKYASTPWHTATICWNSCNCPYLSQTQYDFNFSYWVGGTFLLFALVSGLQRKVFILVPFVKESQTSGRSSASIAHLPPPQGMVNTMIWTSPNNWAEHHVTCPGIPEFEQWACRFLPFLWHPLHLNKETCVKALKKEIISFKVREIML